MSLFVKTLPLLILIFSCTSKKPISGTDISLGMDIPKDLVQFLLNFEQVIKNQNRELIIAYLDRQYCKEQLNNLNENIDQFIDELFCGTDPSSEAFSCMKLDEVKNIQLKNLVQITPYVYEATYLISAHSYNLLVTWNINENNVNTHKYGFIGAYG